MVRVLLAFALLIGAKVLGFWGCLAYFGAALIAGAIASVILDS